MTLLAALSAKTVVAWQLLVLRYLGREMGEADTILVVNALQFEVLHILESGLLNAQSTSTEVMAATAHFGGNIRQNGPPGW